MGLIKQAAEMARETKQCTEFVQKLSVLQWVLTFLFMGVACTVLMVYLLFTSLWLFPVLYTIWMLIDWNTPERGGRQVEWVKNWAVWTHLRNYFPVKIVKTAELSPNRNYILGSHPHGIMCAGAFTSFCTGCSGFSQAFPGMRPTLAILAGLFKMPLYREYLMSAGMCPVSRPSLEFLLSGNGTGNVVVIVIGGAAESLACFPGMNTVVMRQRKGFVRLALECGADLVPVYSFGENELFKQVVFPEGSVMRVLQTAFKKVMGFAPCLFIGQSWGLVPYSVPVTTVVGSPISVPQVSRPSEEMVDHYHSLYMEALTQLFHAHKTSCGLSDTHQLQII
ncbi:2-acylglycerol O-acyltransferase 3b isoform X1 [Anguilla anguilla]|uniref:2-acylglycerol O-acyltransferase 3b isoform X1 n=2 Tax=Anguilla anguilla TaxID=7936 RepID=UPI0015AD39F4|nr:2-acylglycerol O-acyltransferase 3b isoform X1 [Anguilla anguilla]